MRKSPGALLVELLVAIAVVASASVVIAGLHLLTTQHQQRTRTLSAALQQALAESSVFKQKTSLTTALAGTHSGFTDLLHLHGKNVPFDEKMLQVHHVHVAPVRLCMSRVLV